MSSTDRNRQFYTPELYCGQKSLWLALKRAMVSMAMAADERLQSSGVTHAQWGPLFCLKRMGNLTVAELAREMFTDAGATTRMLDRLEKKGLCRRVRSLDDRRVVRVELTEEGEACTAEVPAVLSAVFNNHLADFSEAEWHTLLSLLDRLVANGQAQRGRTAPSADEEA
jgi:DNA-binding MarR family transcriptional regulator